ncbi:MAG TPA: hypothetical protein DCW71_04510 [Alistipes sp.]|nr:hypothetical protein [Alistipes sp.]
MPSGSGPKAENEGGKAGLFTRLFRGQLSVRFGTGGRTGNEPSDEARPPHRTAEKRERARRNEKIFRTPRISSLNP